jgi:hypothetical protein
MEFRNAQFEAECFLSVIIFLRKYLPLFFTGVVVNFNALTAAYTCIVFIQCSGSVTAVQGKAFILTGPAPAGGLNN